VRTSRTPDTGSRGAGIEAHDAAFSDGGHRQCGVHHVGAGIVGAEESLAANLVARVDAGCILKRNIAHRGQVLRFAIISASATVRAPSSILKALSRLALAPCRAAIACRSRRPQGLARGRARPARLRAIAGPSGEPANGNTNIAHAVTVHPQRDRRRGERKGIGFAVP